MAQKKITDLQLISNITDTANYILDTGIQTFRSTALQLKEYVLSAGSVNTTELNNAVFNGLSAVTIAPTDHVAIADASDGGNKKKALISDIINETITTVNNAASPYAVVAADRTIVVNTSAGAVEIDLPAATGSGRVLKIKRDRSDNFLTLDPDGADTIDGETSVVLWWKYDVVELVDTASGQWSIVNKSLDGQIRAVVRYSAQTVTSALTGTYTRVGTLVTVTAAGHTHRVGHYVRFDATSGGAADGSFFITSVSGDDFTFTHGTSGDTSGNCALPRLAPQHMKNVHSVVPISNTQTSTNWVNLSFDMPDLNYSIAHNTNATAETGGSRVCQMIMGDRALNCFAMEGRVLGDGSGTSDHATIVSVFR